MVTAAKTVSQVVTHIGIAFAITYGVTGSVVIGGLALLVEPLINVALLPLHERLWKALRARATATSERYAAVAGEKISQTLMHMSVAFLIMYWLTGSAALGGVAALLEPVCNVLLLPLHDRFWESLRTRFEPAVAAA